MMFDGDGLRMLNATECLARLANNEVHVGRLAFVSDSDELARVQRLPVRPWGPGVKLRFLKVRMEHLTGREIT